MPRIHYYRVRGGWKWVVRGRNGKVIDRADEVFEGSKAKTRQAFRRKIRLLISAVEVDA